jgi:hypothetical protein
MDMTANPMAMEMLMKFTEEASVVKLVAGDYTRAWWRNRGFIDLCGVLRGGYLMPAR